MNVLFSIEKYRQALATQWLGQEIEYFVEIGSTNSYFKKKPADEITHGQICITDRQTKGRGQYRRDWKSEAGKNLTFTLAFRPSDPNRFHVLTLACARAAVAEFEETLDCRAFIKWPNDILIDGKKVAGLLTETMFAGNALDRLLIGIGLNVNQQKFPAELANKATSLRQIAKAGIEREKLLARLLLRIEYEYMRWHKKNDALVKSINQKIIGYGQWVGMQVNGYTTEKRHKLLGINQKGQLTAVSKEGDLETFSYEQIRLATD